MTPRPRKLYEVPAGTPAGRCTGAAKGGSCAQVIYWLESLGGRPLPIDCDVDGGQRPSATATGVGISHFETCVDRDRFRRGAKRQGAR